VDQRTNGTESPVPPGAPRRCAAHVMCSDGAAHQGKSRRLDSAAPGRKARGRSLYRTLGCGDGLAGVPVVVGALSTVHVMALRSYLWPGAFFNASFVVFMTG
jgi:hypothetical protein